MEIEKLKREYGRDIIFWSAGCRSQSVLPYRTRPEVADEVKRRIDDLAAGGGLVLAPSHNVQAGVALEKATTMSEEERKHGVYHK